MKLKCNICGEEDRLFNRLYACHVENCSAAECKKHKGRVLKACSDCGYYFCSAHINNHKCDVEEYVEEYEEYEDEYEEDEEKIENTLSYEARRLNEVDLIEIRPTVYMLRGNFRNVIMAIDRCMGNELKNLHIENVVPLIDTYYNECAVLIFCS